MDRFTVTGSKSFSYADMSDLKADALRNWVPGTYRITDREIPLRGLELTVSQVGKAKEARWTNGL